MNKLEIIQRLLDDRHITAKEAMTLMEKEKEYVYYPHYLQSWTPNVPYWQVNPIPYGGTSVAEFIITTN